MGLVRSRQRINSDQRGHYNVLLVFVMLSVLLCFAPIQLLNFCFISEQALNLSEIYFMKEQTNTKILLMIFLSIFLLIILNSCSCFYLEATQTTKLHLLKSSASEQKITLLSVTKYLSKVCQYSNYFAIRIFQHLH